MTQPPTMTYPQRALQVWSVLALAAVTRTILTYEELSSLTGLPNDSANVLGHVFYYCLRHKLPLLPILVVNKKTGMPSSDLYAGIEIPTEQRRCFEYDWMKEGVPTLKEFEDAYKTRRAVAGQSN